MREKKFYDYECIRLVRITNQICHDEDKNKDLESVNFFESFEVCCNDVNWYPVLLGYVDESVCNCYATFRDMYRPHLFSSTVEIRYVVS
jgi:hypothetical protein